MVVFSYVSKDEKIQQPLVPVFHINRSPLTFILRLRFFQTYVFSYVRYKYTVSHEPNTRIDVTNQVVEPDL